MAEPIIGESRVDEVGAVVYLEEITFPDRIIAGELTYVPFRVSAEYDPAVLNGRSTFGGFSKLSPQDPFNYEFSPIFSGYRQGEPNMELTARFLFGAPGEYRVKALSTKSRADGGRQFKWNVMPQLIVYPDPLLTYQEYMVTVLPPESAAE